jgi:hypothetical protein
LAEVPAMFNGFQAIGRGAFMRLSCSFPPQGFSEGASLQREKTLDHKETNLQETLPKGIENARRPQAGLCPL